MRILINKRRSSYNEKSSLIYINSRRSLFNNNNVNRFQSYIYASILYQHVIKKKSMFSLIKYIFYCMRSLVNIHVFFHL